MAKTLKRRNKCCVVFLFFFYSLVLSAVVFVTDRIYWAQLSVVLQFDLEPSVQAPRKAVDQCFANCFLRDCRSWKLTRETAGVNVGSNACCFLADALCLTCCASQPIIMKQCGDVWAPSHSGEEATQPQALYSVVFWQNLTSVVSLICVRPSS